MQRLIKQFKLHQQKKKFINFMDLHKKRAKMKKKTKNDY